MEKIGDSKFLACISRYARFHSPVISHSPYFKPLTRVEPILTNIPIVDAYFARPADNSTEKAIIIFGDIFGIYQNAKLVADNFAARGILTIIPDILDGDTLSTEDYDNKNVDIPAWVKRHSTDAVDPIVDKVIAHLRETLKVKKIGGVGYCFGAKVSFRQYLQRVSRSGVP